MQGCHTFFFIDKTNNLLGIEENDFNQKLKNTTKRTKSQTTLEDLKNSDKTNTTHKPKEAKEALI